MKHNNDLKKNVLIVCDLDGTLLNNRGELLDNSIKVINDFCDKGNMFIISTGRGYTSIKDIICKLNDNVLIALYDGTCICDKFGNLYYCNTLDSKYFKKYTNIIIDKENIVLIYTIDNYCNECVYVLGKEYGNLFFPNYLERRKGRKIKIIKNFSECEGKKIVFVASIGSRQQIGKIKDDLGVLNNDKILKYTCIKDSYINEMNWIKIESNDNSKKRVIDLVERKMNFKEIVIIGNDINDLSMYDKKYKCIAVKNAIDIIKKMATKVIDSNENEGVAKFISENYL